MLLMVRERERERSSSGGDGEQGEQGRGGGVKRKEMICADAEVYNDLCGNRFSRESHEMVSAAFRLFSRQ
ncbi:hypothetical protein B566_EDAN004542 [Ephemera danica]|nr:hypothetical protein B566_EDAN004542 [Ephemera danica]